MIDQGLIDRFNAKWVLGAATGCWLWTASTAGKGYGQIKLPKQRKQGYAHRISYLIHHGEIPDGMQVCHRCDNPPCVNPEHLFLGTCGDNLQDMKAKGRHLYGEKNSEAKLTDEKVTKIKQMLRDGTTQLKIAAEYGIAVITVSRINTGARWAHLVDQS